MRRPQQFTDGLYVSFRGGKTLAGHDGGLLPRGAGTFPKFSYYARAVVNICLRRRLRKIEPVQALIAVEALTGGHRGQAKLVWTVNRGFTTSVLKGLTFLDPDGARIATCRRNSEEQRG